MTTETTGGNGRPLVGYSSLTGTVYVLKRNGQKEVVPEAQVVAVITGWLDDHDLTVTRPGDIRVAYGGWVEWTRERVEMMLSEHGVQFGVDAIDNIMTFLHVAEKVSIAPSGRMTP